MKYKVTNTTGSDITLNDLAGKVILSTDVDLDLLLNDEFALIDLVQSNDLRSNVASGDITVKDQFGNKVALLGLDGSAIIHYMNVSGTVVLSDIGCPVNSHHIKANGDITSIDHSNVQVNTEMYLMLEQDATGGHTITPPVFDGLDTQPTVTTVAGKQANVHAMKMSGSSIHLHGWVKHTDVF